MTFYDIAHKLAENQVHQSQTHGGENELFRAMADFAGRSGWTFVFTVVFDPGKQVTEHAHVEDVVLYYPDGALETPILVENEPVYPEPGEMILVPKNTKHSVPINETDKRRLSIAMMVTDEEV